MKRKFLKEYIKIFYKNYILLMIMKKQLMEK